MIEIEHIGEHGIIRMRMPPPVSDSDYKEKLVPPIDKAIVEAGLSDFIVGAMMEDARVGLKHWRGFDRVAVVTDDGVLTKAIRAFSVFMSCPVALFNMSEVEDARRWLRESLGSIQQEDMGDGVLHVSLLGKLDTEQYENDIDDLNRFFAAHEKIRLLVDLRKFDGWQGLDGLWDHFQLVRGHASRLGKAAIVGDAGWQDMAVQIGKRVFNIDARHFSTEEYEDAKSWLVQ